MEWIIIVLSIAFTYALAAWTWYRDGRRDGRRDGARVMGRWIAEGKLVPSSEFIKEIEGRG